MLDEFCAGVLIPFEFSNICDLIRLFGMELSLPIDFELVFAGRTYKVIMYPAVSFGVVLRVDFLDPFSDTLILADSISYLSIEPVIVCRS